MQIVYVMGITCVGKSTFMEKTKDVLNSKVGLVEVGKEMRKRYLPERFRGQAAMEDTEDEVFEIYTEQVDQFIRAECNLILVDGQPRFESQVSRIWEHLPEIKRSCLWLFVSDEVVTARINKRFPKDASSHGLSVKRITNDKIQLFPVLWQLLNRNIKITSLHHHSVFDYESFWSLYQ